MKPKLVVDNDKADKERGYPVETKIIDGEVIEVVAIDGLTDAEFACWQRDQKKMCEEQGIPYEPLQRYSITIGKFSDPEE